MSYRIVAIKAGPGSTAGSYNFDIEAPGPGLRVVSAHIAGEGGSVSNMTASQYYLLRTTDSPYINKVQFNYTLSGNLDVFGEVVFEESDEPDIEMHL